MNKHLPPLILGIASSMAIAFTSGGHQDPSPGGADQKAQKPKATYVGAKKCRKCHGDQQKSWKKTNMAKAFDLLKPGERAEAKVKAGLDPEKDYTRDDTCLPCHVTGWGEPGGYTIPPAGDSPEAKKAQKAAKALEGVQCEACHGPASLVMAYKKKNEEYKWQDLVKKGLTQGALFPTKEMCAKCHNEKSPFVEKGYVFDFEKRRDEGTHRHYRMDFDHGCPHKHAVTKKKKKKKKSDKD